MRLRPSGDSGLLVSSLASFSRYQRDEAWTWEHQALVRARALVGCQQLAARFDALRAQVLGRERDEQALAREVGDMLSAQAGIQARAIAQYHGAPALRCAP